MWGGEQNGQRVFSAALGNLLLPVVNGETSSTLFSCVCVSTIIMITIMMVMIIILMTLIII